MKHIRLAALCAALAGGVSAAPAQTTWTLATGYRAESFHTENLAQFGRELEAATGGQLKLTLAPNGSLVKLADIRQAVQDGKIEAGEAIMSGLVKDIPLAGADSVPFVVDSYSNAQRLWQLQRPGIEQQFAQRGLKVLYAVPWPPQGLFSTRPIATVADFKGVKMRTYNQTTVRIAEMLGALPIEVAMVDVGRAVHEGRFQTMITSAVTGVENKVWGPIKYYYEINAWFPKNIVFVNEHSFERLVPEVRNALVVTARAAERRGWLASEAAAESSTKTLLSHGIKIERLSANLETEVKRIGERLSREWVRAVGNEANAVLVPYYIN